MAHAAKVLALLSKSVVGLSTKLSVAAVLGMAALPLLPHDAASRTDALGPQAATPPVEIIDAKPVPLAEGMPVEPVVQVAARRSRPKREPPPETGEEGPPANKTSRITPAPAPEAAAQPAAEPKPEDVMVGVDRTRPKQAPLKEAREPEAVHKPGPAPKASHKTSSIAPAEAEKTPVAPSEAKPDAPPAEPPKPEVWSDAEIIAGLRECLKLLGPIAAEVDIAEPMKREQCGAPAPVLLRRIGSGAHKVEINPPATLNCAMVVGLHNWVEKTLQPAAQAELGSPIARLRNASGYVCRARNGQPLGADRLSEHALANAIDIAGFVTADGRSIDVVRHWGPTARDLREAAKLAAAQAKDAKKEPAKTEAAKPESTKAKPLNNKISAVAHGPEEAPAGKKQDAKSLRKTAALQRLGRGTSDARADAKAIPATGGPEVDDARKSAEAGFLRRLHKGACGVFGTVLGPEANEMHRNHFHFDLAHRRHNALCQ